MPKINVIKPFVFSTPGCEGHKLGIETKFAVGEHEITDETANHPWIKDHFADGCIETPKAAKEKSELQRAAEARDKAAAVLARANAESAMTRATASRAVATEASLASDVDLNTPVNVLKARRGA